MEIINGDVLSTTCIYIAHQCNAMGKMNSGVAKQIREKYPEVSFASKTIVFSFLPEKVSPIHPAR